MNKLLHNLFQGKHNNMVVYVLQNLLTIVFTIKYEYEQRYCGAGRYI